MKKKKTKNAIIDFIFTIAIVAIIAKAISVFIFIVPNVPSASMEPTINIGDRLICTTPFFNPPIKRGDILVFVPNQEEYKNEFWVKRLIGLPGDHVEIKDGIVYVNGERLAEPYVKKPTNYTGSFVVPKDKYLMLGDNRADSLDARFWKNPFIDISAVKYVANFRVYPFNDMGNID